MSEYAGKEVRIAFRHHNVTDEYILALDLIEITHVDTSTPQIGRCKYGRQVQHRRRSNTAEEHC